MKDLTLPPRLCRVFEDYEKTHRDRRNLRCHLIGIPLIEIAIFGFLSALVLWSPVPSVADLYRLDGGVLLLVVSLVYYFILDWRIAAPFALYSAGLYFLGRSFPSWALWLCFVLGWAFQILGHAAFEKKSPAFFRNVKHLLVGPLWVFAEILGYESRPAAVLDRPSS